MSESKSDEGLRFNEGKIRYDLMEPFATQELARVFTEGAKKYAEHNWLKGMKWSKVLASLKRHIAAFESGEDFDSETGCYHMAQAAWNALAIVSYYRHYPQGDDRLLKHYKHPKIGLDLDEVIIDWVGGWIDRFGYPMPEAWHFSYNNGKHFKDDFTPEELSDFYSKLKPKVKPSELPFEPHCYITSRSVPLEITMKWIQDHGFPTVPVYSVGFGESKVDVAKESGIDWFIDDRFDNFVELNNAGICTFLWDANHNKRYEVGYRRVKDFDDFKKRFL